MPSGYTVEIQDNNLSFKDFARLCTQNFLPGRCHDRKFNRWDPPKKVDFSDEIKNYNEMIEKNRKQLYNVTTASREELYREYSEYIKNLEQEYNQKVKEKKLIKEKYEILLIEAKNYSFPREEFRELKKFMIQQLEESIKWDCGNTEELEIPSFDRYIELEIQTIKSSISFYMERIEKTMQQQKEINNWIDDLEKSLESY